MRLKPLAWAIAACLSASAVAMPVGPQVVSGNATVTQNGSQLTVTNSNNAILNWQKFNISPNEIVRFQQSSSTSAVLNRVVGTDPSQIYGQLLSNGRVWLINPAGIMVGPGGRIDTAGFVASTLGVTNQDFLAGRLSFQKGVAAPGSVINQGTITTPKGGSVYLIGANVRNEGIITTPQGETLLAAGETVKLIDTATPGVDVEITGEAGNTTNLGQIAAEAGRIGLAGGLVRNSGSLNASSVVNEGGRIFLKAKTDTYVEGNATVSATGTQGGRVEVLGNRVAVMDKASIDASGTNGGGTVLVGGDYQGKNPDVQNAYISFFGPDATIKVDALQRGNGGKAIVWADDITRAYGRISARGGANSGDGGFVETSGHRYLDFRGLVDTRAPRGAAGMLLLDPADIAIDNSSDYLNGGSFNSGAFSGAYGNAVLTWATINAQSGTLEIRTSSYGTGGAGNININASGSVTGPTTLTLLANGNINIANGVAVNGGSADLNLIAGWNNSGWAVTTGTGNITLQTGSSLSTTGNVWLNAGNKVEAATGGTFGKITAGTLTIGNTNGGALPMGVSLPGANMVDTLAIMADAATANVTFSNAKPLTIGGGQYSISGITAGGNISVNTSSTSKLTLSNTVSAGSSSTLTTDGGDIDFCGGNFSVDPGGTATVNSGIGTIYGTGQIMADTIHLQTNGSVGVIGTSSSSPLLTSSVSGTGNANISIGNGSSGPAAVYLHHDGDATLQFVRTGNNAPIEISASNNLAFATSTSLSAGMSNLALKAGNLMTLPASAAFQGKNVTLIADQLSIAPSAMVTVGTGGILTVAPVSGGRNIELGAASSSSALGLTAAEIDRLMTDSADTTATLHIGSANAGNINISAPLAPAGGFNNAIISLESGGSISQATSTAAITAAQLAVRAAGNVALDTAANNVTVLAGNISGTADSTGPYFHFKAAGNLLIDMVDGVMGISIPAPSGGYTAGTAGGVIALEAGGSLTRGSVGGLVGAAVVAKANGGMDILLNNMSAMPTYVAAYDGSANGIKIEAQSPVVSASVGSLSGIFGNGNVKISSSGMFSSKVSATQAAPISAAGAVTIEADQIAFADAGGKSVISGAGVVHILPFIKLSNWQILDGACSSFPCYSTADLNNIQSSSLFLGVPGHSTWPTTPLTGNLTI
ncbi:MAG TPA: filamentous hemagglutinin N-terminal domain-containing protein, partial [Rhodocyclaceae bacterium]|nr:filamentous hemagglutinin N-terminal domain-containing protein [Rhodocyclaceae bacterium]